MAFSLAGKELKELARFGGGVTLSNLFNYGAGNTCSFCFLLIYFRFNCSASLGQAEEMLDQPRIHS